jgi:hypothetical protein
MAMQRNSEKVEFEAPPVTGTTVVYDGQRFQLIGREPHTRRDGVAIELLVWSSHCAECGDPITVKTPLNFGYPRRRCDEHRRPGYAVARKARRRSRNGWRSKAGRVQ